MQKIINALFFCTHAKTTFPQATYDAAGNKTGDQICCLECGEEIPYSWEEMKRIA